MSRNYKVVCLSILVTGPGLHKREARTCQYNHEQHGERKIHDMQCWVHSSKGLAIAANHFQNFLQFLCPGNIKILIARRSPSGRASAIGKR